MQYLRQSTASQVLRFGPFIDDTDFKTAKTALTIANTDVKLFSHAATATSNKNSGGLTHAASGWYYGTFDATDSATLGRLDIFIAVATALQVWHECTVLPAFVYDVLIGGVYELDGAIKQATAQGAAAQSLTLAAGQVGTDGFKKGNGFLIVSNGTAAANGQFRRATASVASTDVVTLDRAWDTTPTGTIVYREYPDSFGSTLTEIASAVGTYAYEGTETLEQGLRLVRAATAGKFDGATGGATTVHARDKADTKNRITATVDQYGNRSVVTTDVT